MWKVLSFNSLPYTDETMLNTEVKTEYEDSMCITKTTPVCDHSSVRDDSQDSEYVWLCCQKCNLFWQHAIDGAN